MKTVARPSSSAPAIKAAKRPVTAKPPSVQRKSSQEDKEKEPETQGEEKCKEKPKEKPKEKIKTQEPPEEIPCEIQMKSVTPPPPPEQHPEQTTPEEDISAKEIITQAEVHDTQSDKELPLSDKENANVQSEGDDGFLTDATYTVDKREVVDLTATMQHSPIVEEEEKSVLEVPIIEIPKKVSFKADVESTPEPTKPVEELTVPTIRKDEIRVPSTGCTPSTTPEPLDVPSIELNMQVPSLHTMCLNKE